MLFDIERGIIGMAAEQRLAARQELSAPVLAYLKDWMRNERARGTRGRPRYMQMPSDWRLPGAPPKCHWEILRRWR